MPLRCSSNDHDVPAEGAGHAHGVVHRTAVNDHYLVHIRAASVEEPRGFLASFRVGMTTLMEAPAGAAAGLERNWELGGNGQIPHHFMRV